MQDALEQRPGDLWFFVGRVHRAPPAVHPHELPFPCRLN
jgi:hypothetical protein